MTEEYAASRYEEACALLPLRLRTAALLLPLRRRWRKSACGLAVRFTCPCRTARNRLPEPP